MRVLPNASADADIFPIAIERFRPAPDYDFTQPPHEGRLFYENYDWGMTSGCFVNWPPRRSGSLGCESDDPERRLFIRSRPSDPMRSAALSRSWLR